VSKSVLPVLLWAALIQPAIAAPGANLWDKWLAHDSASAAVVDHGTWDAFLVANVRGDPGGINRIAYASVRDTDKAALALYIASLEAVAVSRLNRAEQLAFWINLYNALTVKVVLDNYPVTSIREIKPWFFSLGPWSEKRIQVESEQLSLDDIEHRILRPVWRDARIHYAVNCASVGCPNLQTSAFNATNTERLLDSAAREFINHPRAVAFIDGELIVSSIYEWFKEDFGDTDRGVIAHLQRFASDDLAEQLGHATRIDDDRYDWRLNDVD